MIKIIKKLSSTLIIVLVLLSIFSINVFAKEIKTLDFGTGMGVEDKILKIKNVYDSDSYFTVSGSACYCNQCSDCELALIPARGDLPSGAEAASACYNSWSCCSFARYVFYNTFKCSPESQISVSEDELSYGDYIYLAGRHYAIYLGQDKNNFYVYHGNGMGDCGVEYMDKLDKGTWPFTFGYHAKNYDEVDQCISHASNVTSPSLSQKDGKLHISWNKVDNVSKYKVLYKDIYENNWDTLAIVNGTSYTQTNPMNGKLYTYSVVALNSNNEEISEFIGAGSSILVNDFSEIMTK